MKNLNRSFFATLRLCGIFLLLAFTVYSQSVPAPKDVLGFTPGDDRKLASWAQTLEYFKKLDAASDRVQFQEIGKTTPITGLQFQLQVSQAGVSPLILQNVFLQTRDLR